MEKRNFNFGRRFIIVNTSAWFLIFALTVSESLFFYQINQKPAPYRNILLNDLFILCWIPISPMLFILIKNWYANRSTWLGFILKMLVIGAMAIILVLGIEATIHYWDRLDSEQTRSWTSVYLQLISFRFHSNLILYLGFSAISVATLAFDESRKMKENQAVLTNNLVEAQLGVLKAQMKPHFLFNSLHAISGLILKKQNDLAITVIAKLSDLLRESLNMDDKKWHTLKEELEFIDRYLEIYVLRFGDQLKYSFEVEEHLYQVLIPPALLQPIIENSLVHGIVPNQNQGQITIRIEQKANNLILTILDSGQPHTETDSVPMEEGLGLGNTRKRLASLFGNNFSLEFDHRSNGACTSIVLPITKQEYEN